MPFTTRTRSPVRYHRRPSSTMKRCAVSSARPRYPSVTPDPLMRSSPATRCATGARSSPTTRSSTPGIGPPMGTPEGPKPSATVRMDSDGSCSRSAVAHTVVSVGPYSLTKSTLGRACTCSAMSSAGQASPATTTTSRSHRSATRRLSKARYKVGTMSTWETEHRRITSPSRSTSWTSSSPRHHPPRRRKRAARRAPTTELSKPILDVTRNRSGTRPYQGDRAAVLEARLRCDTTTPRGVPVEPDVKMTYASSSWPTSTARDTNSAAAASTARQLDRGPIGQGNTRCGGHAEHTAIRIRRGGPRGSRREAGCRCRSQRRSC